MSSPFLDRIREATVEPATLDLDALKAAAASASTGLGVEPALTLVRVTNGRPIGPEQDADLRGRINSEIQLLADGADHQLLAVLAGEVLINLFARTNVGVGLVPALAMRCATHVGWNPVHPDVPGHAAAYLRQRAVLVRRQTPPGSRLVNPSPKGEDGSLPRAEEEHETLRSVVQSDRDHFWERDQLAWWLLTETRPPTAFALAREFDRCLLFLPEPVSAEQMIAAKLCRAHGDPHPESPPTVAAPIADLCINLLPQTAEAGTSDTDEEATLVRRFLDQILLSRAYQDATK